MSASRVALRKILEGDADRVASFLHQHLNNRVSAQEWRALVEPPWGADCSDNHGYQLVDADDAVVGVYLAVYSTRPGRERPVCNLAAFCVLEPYRQHSLRLVRALLAQRAYLFTDLSPSGQVPAINERLGFEHLDTATRLVLNLPWASRSASITDSPAALAATLEGRDAEIYRDHRHAPAARHLLATDARGHAYLMYRRDRRKRLPWFASPLHAGGDRAVLVSAWPAVSSHLLRQGLPFTLAEHRVLGFSPRGPGRELEHPRAKMFRGGAGEREEIDYLYSELSLVEW